MSTALSTNIAAITPIAARIAAEKKIVPSI